MFYEEAMIDGALHWRGTPNGKWEPCRPARLNALIAELRAELTASPAQPSGFVLVPVELCAEIEDQLIDLSNCKSGQRDYRPRERELDSDILRRFRALTAAPIEQEG